MSITGTRVARRALRPLVGRDGALHRLSELILSGQRLVTLTGPGGIGKTALAHAVARALEGRYDLGFVLVELAPLQEPEQVIEAVARALASDSASLTAFDVIARDIRDHSVLIVLDNFEHLLSAVPAVRDLLDALPRATLVVTSRVPLHMDGEQAFPVPGLDVARVAPGTCPSSELFVRTVQSYDPTFELSAERAADVTAICEYLGGVPLAIELAAARLRTFSLSELRTQLDHPFAVLRDDRSDRPVRLQSLEANVRWSFDLLSAREQDLLGCCATFVGEFTLEALTDVWGDGSVLPAFERLIEFGFVRAAPIAARYLVLEPLRELAAQHLQGHPLTPVWRERHARHFMRSACRLADHETRMTPDQRLAAYTRDNENFLQALAWFIEEQRTPGAVRFARFLYLYWFVHGRYREGVRWMQRLATLPPPREPEDRLSFVFLDLAWRQAVGRTDGVVALTHELQTLAVRCEDPWHEFRARYLRGACAYHERAYDLARDEVTDALSWFAALPPSVQDEPPFVSERAFANATLGLVRDALGDASGARGLLEDALARHQSIENTYGVAFILGFLGPLLERQGLHARAFALLAECVEVSVECQFWGPLANGVQGIASLGAATDDPEAAIVLMAYTQALRNVSGRPATPPDRDRALNLITTLRQRVPDERFARAWRQGSNLTPSDVLAFVRTWAPGTAKTGGSVPSGARGEVLTPREREVLALVAEGHPDRRVARLLGISTTTASKHVANLLGKLEKRNRVELARWAVDHGLTRSS